MDRPMPFQAGIWWSKDDYVRAGQLENWNNLFDICNAMRYGFSQYRLPKPGEPIDTAESEQRIKKVQDEWQHEADVRPRTCGEYSKSPDFEGLPLEAKCYLHSILTKTPEYPNYDDYYWVDNGRND